MKTVCKKLLCLMLVAMMLVSAVPAAFAADGESTTQEPVTIRIRVDLDGETINDKKSMTISPDDEDWVLDKQFIIDNNLISNWEGREYVGWASTINSTASSMSWEWASQNVDENYRLIINLTAVECDHQYDNGVVTTEPTCTEKGVKTFTCGECGDTYTEEIKALGHDYEGEVTTDPTCTKEGVKTFTCGECGDTYTEPVDALGHDRDDDGVCEVCGDGSENAFTLTFKYLDEDGNWTQETDVVNVGDEIEFPNVPNVSTKDFQDKWKGGDGKYYYDGDDWYGGMTQTFTAQYKSNTTADGIVELEVWAYYYVDGEYHHREELYTKNFEQSKKNTMFTWLYSDEGMDTTAAELEAEGYKGYEWTNLKYYNHYGDNEITEASMKSDGQKSVYIKVESTDEIEAEVMLYVHTKKSSTVDRVIPMDGYTEGDKVTRSDMKAAVKTKYSGSNMSISDMYTDSAWKDLLDGLESSGAESVEIKHNGTTKIHVIVKNASNSSKADSSNPKTGDYITIAVTTMALAAAGLVSIIELKKRKMI